MTTNPEPTNEAITCSWCGRNANNMKWVYRSWGCIDCLVKLFGPSYESKLDEFLQRASIARMGIGR